MKTSAKFFLIIFFLQIFVLNSCYFFMERENSNDPLADNYKPETKAPVPGYSGIIDISDVNGSSFSMSWTKATDNISGQADLVYKVVSSTSDNVDTAENAEANGTVVMDWTANVGCADVTGLELGVVYYVNVLVRDELGNVGAYAGASEQAVPAVGARLTVSDPENATMSQFGDVTAISDDGTVLVSGRGHLTADAGGVVYVYRKPSTGWADMTETAQLTSAGEADNGMEQDGFGKSIAISADGSVLAIGARGEDVDGGNTDTGAVYVYVYNEGTGTYDETAKLTIGSIATSALFGASVAISSDGNTILTVALGTDEGYIFKKPISGWADSSSADAKLTTTDTNVGLFGEIGGGGAGPAGDSACAISADGTVALIPDYLYNDVSDADGAIFLYKSYGTWSDMTDESALLRSSDTSDDVVAFGAVFALSEDGSVVTVGTPSYSFNYNNDGSIHVFVEPDSANGWADLTGNETAILTFSEATDNVNLGMKVAVTNDGSKIIAAALNTDKSVYAYSMPSGGWSTVNETFGLLVPNTEGSLTLPASHIALGTGARPIVLSDNTYNSNAGAVYIYE